jgi:hypothetical protein
MIYYRCQLVHVSLHRRQISERHCHDKHFITGVRHIAQKINILLLNRTPKKNTFCRQCLISFVQISRDHQHCYLLYSTEHNDRKLNQDKGTLPLRHYHVLPHRESLALNKLQPTMVFSQTKRLDLGHFAGLLSDTRSVPLCD